MIVDNVIGFRDCLRHRIELIDEFGMVASDLVLPDPGKQHDLSAIWVGDGRSTRVVGRHSRQADVLLGRALW